MDGERTRFHTTRWSVVLAAADTSSPQARASLEELCGRYWFPLYAHARRKGYSDDAARDEVQTFFASVLERNALRTANPERGRFRNFLLRGFENHLLNARSREGAQKRGGGYSHIQLGADPELIDSIDLGHHVIPEAVFDRDWALSLLRGVFEELRQEYSNRGQQKLFEALSGELEGRPVSHKEVADGLGMNDGAVRVAAHRLRARYGERLRAAVADTVEDGSSVEAELQNLLAALGGGS